MAHAQPARPIAARPSTLRATIFLPRPALAGVPAVPALDRDPGKVVADVEDGYLTAKAAKEEFGVVIEKGKLSAAKTAALRKKLSV